MTDNAEQVARGYGQERAGPWRSGARRCAGVRQMTRLALCAALLMLCTAPAMAAPDRKVPVVGLVATDSTFRILSVGGRESRYPYIRSWVEPDTIRFVDVMVMPDSAKADSSGQFSVSGYNRCRVVAYKRDGAWRIDLECWRDAR